MNYIDRALIASIEHELEHCEASARAHDNCAERFRRRIRELKSRRESVQTGSLFPDIDFPPSRAAQPCRSAECN